MDLFAVRCRGSSRSDSRTSRSSSPIQRCVDGDHEADAVVAGSEIHGVVEPVDDADALPHDVGEAGHVDVVQLALDVAGLHQCDVAMVVGVVGVIGKLAGCCEPFQQLLNDRLGGVVVGELRSRSDRDVNVFMVMSSIC